MPRKLYDPQVKAALISAARDAIKAGKGMAGALTAAKDAGYTGGQSGLGKMLYAPKKKGKKAKAMPAIAPAEQKAVPAATPKAASDAPAAPTAKKPGRKIYDPKVKAQFIAAASTARKAGNTWVEAYAEAKKAGYTGTLGGLGQMFIKPAAKKGKKAAPAAKPAAKAVPAAILAKKRTGRRGYDPAAKAAFLAAAKDARAAGKSWAEAHAEAKKAGYMGSRAGLVQQFLAKKAPKAKKAGRPAGSKNATTPANLGSLQSAIDRIVSERVSAAIGKAIEALHAAAK